MAYRVLTKFDPGAKYLAARVLLVAGTEINPGGVVPKRKLTERRLRQLFHARRIVAAPTKEKSHG